MNTQRNSRRPRNTNRRRTHGGSATRPHKVESPPEAIAEDLLADVSGAIGSLECLHTQVQRQFTKWSKDPPLASNRQTRFANTLDEWAAEGKRLVQGFREATAAGKQLPSLHKCTVKERAAKRILTGLKALEIEDSLTDLFDQMQSIANQARQPLTSAEANKLWDEFTAIVHKLNGVGDDIGGIQELIQHSLRRDLAASRRSAAQAVPAGPSGGASQQPTSLSRTLTAGDRADAGLVKINRAVDRLWVGLSRILKDLAITAKSKRGRESLLSQQEEIQILLMQYDTQARLFRDCLRTDPDCREVFDLPRGEPLSDLAFKVRTLIERMDDDSTWCIAWLVIIRQREAAAFTLPRHMPDQIATFIRKLRKISRSLSRSLPGQGAGLGAHQSYRRNAGKTVTDMAALNDDDIAVLRSLLDDTAERPACRTVRSVAAETRFSEQKVRRILRTRLGKGADALVKFKKIKRNKDCSSPGDVFFVNPAAIDFARQIVHSHPQQK